MWAIACFSLTAFGCPGGEPGSRPARAAWEISQAEELPIPQVVKPPDKNAELKYPAELTSGTVVARAEWGDITYLDLLNYYRYYLLPANVVPFTPVVAAKSVPDMPISWFEKLARNYAMARESEKIADSVTDPELTKKIRSNLNNYLLNYVLPELRKRRVDDQMKLPSEEEMQKYYELHKPEFFQPFQFKMRHIFLSTYERYTLKAGEDLESVATNISGDPSKVNMILSDSEGRPPRWVPREQRRYRLFKPEFAGEKLLVPMSPENVAGVRKRMEEIAAKLAKGEAFEDLAKKYSESENKEPIIGPLPSGVSRERGVLDAILEAAAKLPAGQPSQIIQTKHGFHLILLTERQEERMRPFEEVKAEIVERIKKEQREKLEKQMNDDLFAMPELKINYDIFAKAPDLPMETVMVTVGDDSFTWKDIEGEWRKWIGEGADQKRIFEGLKGHGGIAYSLAIIWANQNNIFADPNLKLKYDILRTGVLGMVYTKNELEAAAAQAVTEEAINEYYQSHKETEFSLPAFKAYHIIERRLGPAMAGKSEKERSAQLEKFRLALNEKLKQFKNVAEFVEFAEKTNPPESPALVLSALNPVNPDQVPGLAGAKVKEMKTGEWTKEAFLDGDVIHAVGVTDELPPKVKALVEVKKEVYDLLTNRAKEAAKPKLEQTLLDKAKFEFVLK
ncbi:peptidyl-prolyl cis-trans isomerase [Candidatus Sumerlaeota bacterium]|nr:peptidyl-prolyl cis-trans isomerase [Candidatus Sumerlaeota bacterium]MBI3736355.1 peptidyl-prolyl cis-trans isomerase [Candidatus Sumerlaeota bacterium]